MTTEEAFEIVYALARVQLMEVKACPLVSPESLKRIEEWQIAVDTVHDFLVNNVFE